LNQISQPDWLREITYGLAEGRKTGVLIDGKRFAVVKSPGGTWFDNSGGHYGATTYYLVDKEKQYRKAHGLLDCRELQHGGRAKMAQWKKLVDGLDRNPWRISESFDDLDQW
jgi:hypothetical protein